MLIFRGRMPKHNLCARYHRRSYSNAIGVFTALLLCTNFVFAQDTLPLTLQEAEELALYDEPGQNVFLSRAEGLREKSVAGGQLPDPSMRVGLANYPIQSGGFTTEGMTQAQLGIQQVFPRGDTRELTARKFQSQATEMSHRATGRGRDVLTSVRVAWLETHYWREAQQVASESRPFFDDLVTITRSLYSVGRKNQQDLLRAELELSRLDDRIIDMGKQYARSRATLSQWVGQDADRPVAAKLPEWNAVPPLEVLQDNLQQHPALLAANATIGTSLAGVELAKQEYKSDWKFDLGYGYRNGELSNGDPRSDFISLAVTFDLPFFRKNRQDRSVGAALSEKRAADHSREEVSRRLASQLEAEYIRWLDLGKRIELYERLILSVSRHNADASMVAYQSDAADFADVMRAYVDDLDTRIDYIRLEVERSQSFAVLANLGGISR